MTQKSLISIIIPVYNTEQYLSKCLDSVINQTYKNLEIIVIDDGSTDNSGKICDEYALKDNRIKVVHKQNAGVSSARNIGLDIARGEYIAFIDSDDYIELDMYESLLKISSENFSDVTCSGYYLVYKNKIYSKRILKEKNSIVEISNIKAVERGFIDIGFYIGNKLFNKECFLNLYFPAGDLFEDISVISKVFIKAKKIVIYNRPLYYYNRTNLMSVTKQPFNIKKLDYFKATDDILEYAKNNKHNCLIKIIKEERAYHIVGFFRQMIENNFYDSNIINFYTKELRENILLHLLSKHKLSNKLFALVTCISFNLAKKVYKMLSKGK